MRGRSKRAPGRWGAAVLAAAGAAVGAAGCGSDGQRESVEEGGLPAPGSPEMSRAAPDSFRVRFETTAGPFVVLVRRQWAPNGADRFYSLVRQGFYDGARFFRVIEGFVAQFGIPGDPDVASAWRDATIPDDPVRASNERGTLTFATRGANSRTTQLFINYRDNSQLDAMGFAPIGEVVEGMDAVDGLYAGYGEGAPRGQGPEQARIQTEGNAYLEASFPRLDHIEGAEVVGRG